MKRWIPAVAVAVTLFATSGSALADDVRTGEAASSSHLLALDDSSDAWLHEHCSYRGLVVGALPDAGSGVVYELIELTPVPTSKAFRCVERPPFWTSTWTPASQAELTCTNVKEACTPPLSSEPPRITPQSLPISSPPSANDVRRAATPAMQAPSTTSTSGGSTLGWVFVGTGITALIGAGIAGGVVLGAKSTMASHCSSVLTCDAEGLRAADRGKTANVVGSVAFVAGAAALTVGIVVLVTGKPRERSVGISARPQAHGASVALEGRF